jgi:hypothetical protein
MFEVFIEMPLGNRSKPHEFAEESDARKLFDSFVGQMRPWKNFKADVILTADGRMLACEGVGNA